MSIGTEKAYEIIDRKKMYNFFLARKSTSGGFAMHDDGENDVRATYTVLAVASILNILTPELVQGTAEWVAQCQTYEGGFGGEPFNEAHGGYVLWACIFVHFETDTLDQHEAPAFLDCTPANASRRWVPRPHA